MNRRKVRMAYYNHKRRALRLNREFSFSFEEWKQWWFDKLGHDWFVLRGRGKERYCMSRIADKGGYTSNNVFCQTNSENCSQATHLRVSNLKGRSKLTVSNVGEIRKLLQEGISGASLAREFKVRQSTISGIKLRKTWQ